MMIEKTIVGALVVSVLFGVLVAAVDGYRYIGRVAFSRSQSADSGLASSTISSERRATSGEPPASKTPVATATPNLAPEPIAIPALSSLGTATVRTTPTSEVLLRQGSIAPTWRSNSWGVVIVPRRSDARPDSRHLLVDFKNPWSALSLYSSGLDLRGVRSIILEFSGASTTITKLHLAFYQGKNRLGAVPIGRYLSADGTTVRIPISDMGLNANFVTDVVCESELPGAVEFRSIGFSASDSESRIPSESPAVVPVVESTSSVALSPVSEPTVYFAGTKNGWNVSARRATIELDDESRSITGNAIKIRFTSTTSALTFFQPREFDTTGYDYVRLMLYGGTTDYAWQQIYLSVYDSSGKRLGTADIAGYSGNGRILNQVWKEYDIPLAVLGAHRSRIATLEFENASVTQEGDALWFDDLSFGSY